MVEQRGAGAQSFPRHIQLWIAKSLAEGYSANAVCRKLNELGYDERDGRSEIAKVTATPGALHHDSSNIFFGRVFGSKRIRLVSPLEIGNIYNDRFCYSAVDLESPDFTKFPRLAGVPVLDATVVPGDFLLIPGVRCSKPDKKPLVWRLPGVPSIWKPERRAVEPAIALD